MTAIESAELHHTRLSAMTAIESAFGTAYMTYRGAMPQEHDDPAHDLNLSLGRAFRLTD